MFGSLEPSRQPEPDALEIATDQAIAACDGDVRATVRALIVANGFACITASMSSVYHLVATIAKAFII